MYEMDNELKLVDVINDPVALNHFLEFPGSDAEPHNLHEVVSNATEDDFLNFENCHLEYSSAVDCTTDVTDWNFHNTGLSSNVSSTFFDPSMVSAVSAQSAINVPLPTLSQRCGTSAQNIPVGYIPASASNYSTSQNFVQIQPSGNNINNIKQLSGSTIITTDNSIQRIPNTSKIVTNFAVANSVDSSSIILSSTESANGSQVLMNVHPQAIMQNGAVRIQYIQVQNHQLPSTMPAGTMVQNMANSQLAANNLKPVQLQQHGQLVAHGVQGGINLQGTLIPTAAGNRILIQTGNQPVSGAGTGQINLQPMQICGSNFVGGTQDPRLPQVTQHVTSIQQSPRVQQPQMATIVGRTNAVTGQVIGTNINLSGGRQVVLQRAPGVTTHNVVYRQLPQQQTMTLPVEAITSQENKLPDGLVVQIGGQMYRFEPSQQSTGATSVRQSAVFPHMQGVGFSDGTGVAQDPVKMLEQNVQLQQMLIGNQINVLQMLQKQQQQQSLQSKAGGQQFTESQATVSSEVVINPIEDTNCSSNVGGPVLTRTAFVSQPLGPQNTLEKIGFDPLLQGNASIAPVLRPSLTTASMSQSGLQVIQPKPTVSIGIPSVSSSGVVGQSVSILQPGTNLPLGAQMTASNANRSIVGINMQPSTQVATTLSGSHLNFKSGNLQGPQNIQPVAGGQMTAGQSQAVTTTVQLSTEQQNLLVKIQSQMKALLDLPKRNPDQEKYLQMLVSGQQRIISQGVSQYLQQQKTAGIKVGSGVTGGAQQQNVVIIAHPATSAESGSLLKVTAGNAVTDMTTATRIVSSTSSAMASMSTSSSPQNSGQQVKAEDLFQAMPHLKEKLEAHMAKMSPEQRQWFAKNQSVVFAKLQHSHRLLLERDKKEQQEQPSQQQLKHLTSPQLQNSTEASASSEAAATRIIRSLHLTRAQKFHLYLQKDQKRATHPEHSKAFENFKDVIRGLVPYHVFQTREPSVEDVSAVEETFEDKAREMLERKDIMLRKYRLLLMEESMRPQLTSEMVLLERAFHSDEKALLLDEKRQAEEDPDSFVPRPVFKRLKVDNDFKKEEDDIDCKDEEMTQMEDVTESTELKIESASLDENVIKLESSSCPSSPTNACSMANLSSVERYKSLQIKLEKLDDTGTDLLKHQNKIGQLDFSIQRVSGDIEVAHDDDDQQGGVSCFANSESSEIPTNTNSACFSFTEDDVAVASLLNTERLNNISHCNFEKHYVNKIENTALSEESATGVVFDKGIITPVSENADFHNSSFANVGADLNASDIANEPDNDDFMQGTINSLMADLTQFNYDLNNSSWADNELRGDSLNGSIKRTAVPNSSSTHNSSQQAGCSTESLQYEMQCAIDSIIQLQQPRSGNVGTSSDLLAASSTNCPKAEDEESSLDAAVNSIL